MDAETGCLLRLISYVGDTLAIWSELDDISTEPADPDEFRVHVPPGTRTVEETGNLFANAVAVMPGVKGTAARAAAEAVSRTAGAVSAADRGPVKETSWRIFRPGPASIVCIARPGTCCAPPGRATPRPPAASGRWRTR